MFENATRLQFRPSALNEGLKILRSQVVPILKVQSGLLSLALIPNHETNQVTILSIWTNRTCARIVEFRSEYRQAIQMLDPLILPHYQSTAPLRPLAQAPVEERSMN